MSNSKKRAIFVFKDFLEVVTSDFRFVQVRSGLSAGLRRWASVVPASACPRTLTLGSGCRSSPHATLSATLATPARPAHGESRGKSDRSVRVAPTSHIGSDWPQMGQFRGKYQYSNITYLHCIENSICLLCTRNVPS